MTLNELLNIGGLIQWQQKNTNYTHSITRTRALTANSHTCTCWLKVHIHFRKFSMERKIFRGPHAQYDFFLRKIFRSVENFLKCIYTFKFMFFSLCMKLNCYSNYYLRKISMMERIVLWKETLKTCCEKPEVKRVWKMYRVDVRLFARPSLWNCLSQTCKNVK